MTGPEVLDIARDAIWTIMLIGWPVMIAGLVVAGFGLAPVYLAPTSDFLLRNYGLLKSMLLELRRKAVVQVLSMRPVRPDTDRASDVQTGPRPVHTWRRRRWLVITAAGLLTVACAVGGYVVYRKVLVERAHPTKPGSTGPGTKGGFRLTRYFSSFTSPEA